MIINPSKAKGKMTAPPSKSMAHRYLICAALAQGKSVIHNIDLSEDIKATLGCIERLGVKSEITGSTITVYGNDSLNSACSDSRLFNCNESGSTLRFFIPLAMLDGSKSFFIGSDVLMTRPLSVYEEICSKQNILLEHKVQKINDEEKNGIAIEGKLKADDFVIPGNISSQFITGLLFALPLLDKDSTITLTESVESRPYIDMTLQVQKEFGISAELRGENKLFIPGNQKYRATDTFVEGDYSNAAFFEALNTLGGEIEIEGLNPKSLQGDKVYIQYFEELKKGFASLDISDCPDLGPILFTLAAALHGGDFTGTKRLKIKESNRGQVMCEELAKFGVKTLQEENRIIINAGELHRPVEKICGHNDHRIVMSMAVLLTITGGEIVGTEAVRKSLPDFFERIRKLGIDFQD